MITEDGGVGFGDADEDRDGNGEESSPALDAINLIRDIIGLPPAKSGELPQLYTPIFLSHGTADEKVSINLVRDMASLLAQKLGIDVTWKEYKDCRHWYKVPEEIDDVLLFLLEKVGMPVQLREEEERSCIKLVKLLFYSQEC
ncbi:hypothetical protein AJ78_07706 [Emergomyces pasteurianus Ep9510]|uniref:Phospholipase/carboxylesterase/thioesterase domain-containing protein n=1 Tax=Emergomyces pasteurianus Ep9510 TaxID=1447872 RepID=A0A1J9P6M9_9EURO|nr:hypothetical protein AJ78_07706 [Emergomyces pasteurianus Ep9510]